MRSERLFWATVLSVVSLAAMACQGWAQQNPSESDAPSGSQFSFSDAPQASAPPAAGPQEWMAPPHSQSNTQLPNAPTPFNPAAADPMGQPNTNAAPSVPASAKQYPFSNGNTRTLTPLNPSSAAQFERQAAAAPDTAEMRFDPVVQPAVHVDPSTSGMVDSTARDLIQVFDPKHWTNSLPGAPLSLTDALATAPPDSRRELISAYWNAFEKWAGYVTIQREATQLAGLNPGTNRIDQELLASAKSLVQARLVECEMELESAQRRLQMFLPVRDEATLPLPNDLPLVDEYLTQISTIRQWVFVDSRMSQIDRTLPKSLTMIRARSDAAARCHQVVDDAIDACNRSQLALGSALEAIRMCREGHLEFLRTVCRYNLDIAEYAIAVAPWGHPAPQVVAMLIKSPQAPTGHRMASMAGSSATPLAPVSNESSRPQTSNANFPPARNATMTPITASKGAAESVNPMRSESRSLDGMQSSPPWTLSGNNAQPVSSTPGDTSVSTSVKPPAMQPPPVLSIKPSAKPTSGGGSFSLGNR